MFVSNGESHLLWSVRLVTFKERVGVFVTNELI